MAGVSAGTVDRILHNRGKVSEKSRAKVEQVLKEVDYKMNIHASAISFRKEFTIVIAIEFLQMLSKPDTDNVIEIILFLVARHMIVGETTPMENLISIVGITILIILRWFIHDLRRKYEREQAARRAEGKSDVSAPPKS